MRLYLKQSAETQLYGLASRGGGGRGDISLIFMIARFEILSRMAREY